VLEEQQPAGDLGGACARSQLVFQPLRHRLLRLCQHEPLDALRVQLEVCAGAGADPDHAPRCSGEQQSAPVA
jgi:hypothetical protein